VRAERRLPLWRFRDAIAAASIMALPLKPDVAAGVTVLPMAMALGTPVVATRTIWTEQYAVDGEHALLVAPRDAHAFRAAVVRLHEDGDLRARLATNARRRVVELYDLDRFTAEMFATLEG
jgi:glycosyltransferase involved in cell wall biosynthesis